MKVLVTGAAGYMGKYVVKELLIRGHQVLAVDLNHKDIDSRAEILDVDIFNGNDNIYEQCKKPELCIHLAWQDGFVHNSYKHMENLSSHFKFLKSLMDGGCKRLAIMGTMHEVGFYEGAIDENTPCNPLSQYGIAKNALRQAMIQLTKGTDIKLYWLRAFYILGDDSRNSSIFTKLLQAAEDGKKEFPFTTGISKYDFIDVKELAKQIVAASTQDKIVGIINVCTGKPISLREKVESFIKEKGLDIQLQYGAFPERPYDSKIIYGDNTKIMKIMHSNN